MMTFEEKFSKSNCFQVERYNRIIQNFEEFELTDNERGYLLWLAGWDNDTENAFVDIFNKLKKAK